MPGLIDTHTHMWNCLWRTLDTPYIYGHTNLGPQYRPEDSYNAVRLCAAEFLFGGITTVHAWEHNVRSPAHADAELKALTDMGMRTHYSYGYYHHLPSDQPMNLEDILRVRKQWQGETVTVGYASRPDTSDGSPQTQWPTATPAVRKLEWDFARRERLPITHHVTTPASQPAAYYEVAGPDVLLVHGYQWGLETWQRLAKAGARVSLSPYSAANYRTPVPFRELFEAGMPVSLSFDHMNRTGNADFFRMLVLASNIEHLRTGAGLGAHRALELVTIDGARALGLGDMTGSLTPGKRADLILIRTDALNMTPMVSPERAVVNSARPESVDTVMVNGRVVKSRGVLTAADARRVVEDAARSLKAILQRAG
jgi:5-methylthioadenosine/S-adenosylhomocysteine deaminase